MALDEFMQVPFGNGAPRWFLGTATPSGGTFYTGDIIFNSAPTGGASATFWMCRSGSTSGGTWIAQGQAATGSAAPNDSAVVWALGDIVWNSAPLPNAPSGWVCTTAGAGATANFTSFGEIGLLSTQTTTATSGTLSSAFSTILLNPASTGTYSLPNVTAYSSGARLFVKNIASGSTTLTPLAANNYEATSIAAITMAQNAKVCLLSGGGTTWYLQST